MSATPPRLAERLLRWSLRRSRAAICIVGDLRQEYAAVRARRGTLAARLWYWREAFSIGGRYMLTRHPNVSPSGLGDRRAALATPTTSLSRDVAQALLDAPRVFRSSPGFSLAVVLTLALGLGVNATMFGAVDRVLLSPPEHVQNHETLRFLHLSGLGARSLNSPTAYAFPDYEAIRNTPGLAGAAAFRPRIAMTMGAGEDARRVIVQNATAEFFPLLGVRPAAGRSFDLDDDRAGAPPTAVLSHGFWEREFGGDPGALGRTVTLGSHDYEVIGIAPRGFTGATLEAVDVWVPARMNTVLTNSSRPLENRGAWWFRVVVRLEDGVDDDVIANRLTEAHRAAIPPPGPGAEPNDDDSRPAFVHAGSFMTALGPNADNDTATTLWLAGVSLLVLLIACANVTNLLLARGIDRQRERAVRLAFGVSRRRLLVQALCEALILAAAGGAAALMVSMWSGRALYELLLPGFAVPESAIDRRLVAFLAVVVVGTTVLAGLLPALQAVRTAPGDVLRKARRGSTRGGGRIRDALTLGQVALSTVMLVAAGLFVQSLNRALDVDPGYDYESLIAVVFELQGGADPQRRNELYREGLRSLEGFPGVASAALSKSGGPVHGWDEMSALRASGIDSIPLPTQGGPYTYGGSEGFVETAGFRVVRGRGFEPADHAVGALQPLLVSRALADGTWPGRDPLRECLTLREGTTVESGPEPCRPVVGVYENLIVMGVGDEGQWSLTWPLSLEASRFGGILVRAEGDPIELAERLRPHLLGLSSDIRFVQANPTVTRIESMRGPWKVGATLFSAFGVLALLVASLGLYSVLAFAVARRSREIGIRSALGAQRKDLVTMVVGRAVRLVAVGLALGLGFTLLTGRFLESVLFGVPTVNLPVFAIVAGVFAIAGLAAAGLPAWKATSIDPAGAMAVD